MPILWKSSPNKVKGRGGYRPEALVIHVMEGTLPGTDAWFANPASKVSAHYGLGKGGAVHQYVLDTDQAWHAGRVYSPSWKGIHAGVSPNRYTIGIEHEGRADDVWPEAMLDASATLIRDLCTRWAIPIDRDHVVGHREIYARKTCPGNTVDLAALVKRARRESVATPPDRPSGGLYNSVEDRGRVEARMKLNVRTAPTSAAPKVRTAPAGASLDVHGWTSSGETVSGNPHWYRLADGHWAWAGGTHTPIPALDGVRC